MATGKSLRPGELRKLHKTAARAAFFFVMDTHGVLRLICRAWFLYLFSQHFSGGIQVKRLAQALAGIIFLLGAISALPLHGCAASQNPNDKTDVSSNGPSIASGNKKDAQSTASGEENNLLKDKKTDPSEPKADGNASSSSFSFGGSFRVRTGWTGNN